MNIIKLNAIDSTNSYLKRVLKDDNLKDFTVVLTDNQTNGRGQMGAVWSTQSAKNLTFSIYKEFSDFEIKDQFSLNMGVSLGVFNTLKKIGLGNVKIKWPNDILADNLKICGILIENGVKGRNIRHSIVGIGLNVNQEEFVDLDHASSLKNILKKDFCLDTLLFLLLESLEQQFDQLLKSPFEVLKVNYLEHLFRYGQESKFVDKNDHTFFGTIEDISSNGLQVIRLKNGNLKAFSFKEVQLVY